jgi:ribosomal protein S12 methylthiotransferase
MPVRTQLPIIDSSPSKNPSQSTPSPQAGKKGNYAFISLGCPKNTVDSERMMGLLQLDGYQLVNQPENCDFVIVNTCGFIEQARKESFSAIDEMLDLKKQGKIRGVIVSGCLAERQKEQMLIERPGIDSLVGVFGREEVTRIADRLIGDLDEQRNVFQPAPIRALPDHDRFQITPKHFAYLKVSEGCDRLCTFCAIPKMRGKHATKPIEQIIAEANQLGQNGVRELIIVAQDTTYYGKDLYGEPKLRELLLQLDQVESIDWIRLMYFYPMYIDDQLLDTINSANRILPYIDMPLQHINDTMLKRMSRRVNREETEKLIRKMRDRIKNLTLRSTLITGFPGETDEHFQELAGFVHETRFDHLGVFTYSYEPDTPSAKLADHVNEETKEQRREHIMAIQQQIAFELNDAQVGQTCDVIIDQPVPDQSGVWVGRSKRDAPDVDGLIFVTETDHQLKLGDIVSCEIVATNDYDLVAAAVDVPR